MDSTASEQYKLVPQSARTRCVKPLTSHESESAIGYAKWNELFIFEVPEKVTWIIKSFGCGTSN